MSNEYSVLDQIILNGIPFVAATLTVFYADSTLKYLIFDPLEKRSAIKKRNKLEKLTDGKYSELKDSLTQNQDL